MKVQVKLYATLREYAPEKCPGAHVLELPDGATVAMALEQLKVPKDRVAFVFVNSTLRKLDEPLADGEELGVFPPIAGG